MLDPPYDGGRREYAAGADDVIVDEAHRIGSQEHRQTVAEFSKWHHDPHTGVLTPGAYRTIDTARGPLRAPTLDYPLVAAFVAGSPVNGLTAAGAVARMLFDPNAGGLTLTDALAALGYSHGPADNGKRHIYDAAGERVATKGALEAWPWLREQVVARGMVPARLREVER